MPTYEYLCDKCGNQFEIVQPISAKALEVCPKDLCSQKNWGKGRVKRAISGGAGLIFRGSGFYITDYRSEKYKEAAKKDSAPTTTADSKPGSKKEKTSPAKPESSANKSTTSKT